MVGLGQHKRRGKVSGPWASWNQDREIPHCTSGGWLKYLVYCHQYGKPQWSPWHLASGWLSPGVCSHLRNEVIEDPFFRSYCLLKIYKNLKNFENNNMKLSDWAVSTYKIVDIMWYKLCKEGMWIYLLMHSSIHFCIFYSLGLIFLSFSCPQMITSIPSHPPHTQTRYTLPQEIQIVNWRRKP